MLASSHGTPAALAPFSSPSAQLLQRYSIDRSLALLLILLRLRDDEVFYDTSNPRSLAPSRRPALVAVEILSTLWTLDVQNEPILKPTRTVLITNVLSR